MNKNILSGSIVAVALIALASFGFQTAFGYGGGGGDETISLTQADKWVTISPSKKLTAFSYNGSDVSSILAYDASSASFVVPSASDLLNPINAFYLKPNKSTSVSFTYDSSAIGPVSKALSTGWNFVGTNADGKAVDEFSTLGSAASTLYVPDSLNTNKSASGSSWGSNGNRDLDKTSWSTEKLDPRDGYWIYLISPATWSKIL